MAYPKELLQPDEKVVLDRTPHWSYLSSSIAMLAIAIVVTVVLAFVQPVFLIVGAICIAILAVGALGRFLRWRTTNFVVTDQRLIRRTGIFAKSGIEIPLDRVTNISYSQSLIERMLGCGDLVIESAGESGQQRFSDVAGPQKVQNVIYEQSEKAESRNQPHDGSGPHQQLSIPDQIEKLSELRERGVLTDQEFDEKKQELLDRM